MSSDKPVCGQCNHQDKSIFCSLGEQGLSLLNSEKESKFYKKGQNLFLEGNPHFGLYCINSGAVKLTRVGSLGKETIIRIAKTGDVIGHKSFFAHTSYTASSTVLEDASVCLIKDKTVDRLLQLDPNFGMTLLKRLSLEITRSEDRLYALSQKNIRQRLAHVLLYLVDIFGRESEDGIEIQLKLSREEYASLIGAAHENVIRLFTAFKKEGLLSENKKQLTVKNLSALIEVSKF